MSALLHLVCTDAAYHPVQPGNTHCGFGHPVTAVTMDQLVAALSMIAEKVNAVITAANAVQTHVHDALKRDDLPADVRTLLEQCQQHLDEANAAPQPTGTKLNLWHELTKPR
jgi:hypothetical protein